MLFSVLVEPTRGVNYDFVVVAYAIACLICIILYAVWHVRGECEGWWLVFAPFAPALLWGVAIRRRWRALGWDKIDISAEFQVEEEVEKCKAAEAAIPAASKKDD